jgi:hypothetical protein
MYTSRLCRDRAEELRPVHNSRLRKASSSEQVRNALLWLAGVDREAERHVATVFEHALYLPQSRARIRPSLHRIDRERLVERLPGGAGLPLLLGHFPRSAERIARHAIGPERAPDRSALARLALRSARAVDALRPDHPQQRHSVMEFTQYLDNIGLPRISALGAAVGIAYDQLAIALDMPRIDSRSSADCLRHS